MNHEEPIFYIIWTLLFFNISVKKFLIWIFYRSKKCALYKNIKKKQGIIKKQTKNYMSNVKKNCLINSKLPILLILYDYSVCDFILPELILNQDRYIYHTYPHLNHEWE